jgi:hypothetical protein
MGEADRSPISQAAPTFCIIEPTFDAIWAMNSPRKTAWCSGAQADGRAGRATGAASVTPSVPAVTRRR